VWNEESEVAFKYPLQFWHPGLVSPRSGGKDPGISLALSNPVRLSHVLPGYLDRVGTYYLPVSFLYGLPSFLLIRFPCFTITKSQISEFGYYFGVKSKKIRIRIPTEIQEEISTSRSHGNVQPSPFYFIEKNAFL
jgi:hypothetical protein